MFTLNTSIPCLGHYCIHVTALFLFAISVLAENFLPMRKQIYSRYVKFFQRLFTSTSIEVRHLARIVSRYAQSDVFRNIQVIQKLSSLSPWDFSNWRIVQNIENVAAPPNNEWRLSLLKKLLDTRRQKASAMEDISRVTLMIESLCNT